MHNIIVVRVCQMNLFYVFTGPILKHLDDFGQIRLLPRKNTRFFPEDDQYGYHL